MIYSILNAVFLMVSSTAGALDQPEKPGVRPPDAPMEIHVRPTGGAEDGSGMEIKVRKPDEAAVPGVIATAADLLAALEAADANVKSMTADLVYDKTFDIAGDRQVRWGKLTFTDDHAEGARSRKFAIAFDRLRVGSRLEKEEKHYVFDGRWLVERLPGQKQFIKTEIVREGDSFDPLRIGEGPMPILIGQRKDETLARFDAELLAAEEGVEGESDAETESLRKHIEGTRQLRLVPKPGTEQAKDFREIRVWYRQGTSEAEARFLPVMARTENRAGDISLVRLSNVKLNGAIDAKVMDTTTPGEDWKTDIRRIGGRAP